MVPLHERGSAAHHRSLPSPEWNRVWVQRNLQVGRRIGTHTLLCGVHINQISWRTNIVYALIRDGISVHNVIDFWASSMQSAWAIVLYRILPSSMPVQSNQNLRQSVFFERFFASQSVLVCPIRLSICMGGSCIAMPLCPFMHRHSGQWWLYVAPVRRSELNPRHMQCPFSGTSQCIIIDRSR
jgi:hypothetical protein